MDAYRQALTYEPDDPDAHYLIALQLLATEPATALEHLGAARKVLPDSPSLLLASARAQLATGRVDPARRTLHLLLSLQDQMNLWSARESWSMAHILLADLEPGEAETHWEKAWSIHRRTAAEARFLQRRDLPRVLDAFRAEAKENPWDWYSQANLGLALLETGQAAESVPHLRKAVRLAPEREAVRFQLARALLEDGRDYAALRILDRLLEELPDCPLRRQVHDLRDRAALPE
jgi:predicted Zn-dependent protease